VNAKKVNEESGKGKQGGRRKPKDSKLKKLQEM
jgi:hypothetical protein